MEFKDARFLRTAVRTYCRFDSAADACRIVGFFVGKEMEDRVRNMNQVVIPEYTGFCKRMKESG